MRNEHRTILKGSRLSLWPFQKNRYVEMASHLYITDEGKCLRWCQTFRHPWHPLFLNVNEMRQCKKLCFEKRTANVLVLKSDSEGSNPRVSRGLHTHAPRRGQIQKVFKVEEVDINLVRLASCLAQPVLLKVMMMCSNGWIGVTWNRNV